MKLAPNLLKEAKANSDVLPGNIYPAQGGKGRVRNDTRYWLVVSVSSASAYLLGFDDDGLPVSTASYQKGALRERPIIGRADLSGLVLGGTTNQEN